MSNEVVDLLSDSEDDIQLCEQPSSITPTSPPKSEDEYLILNLIQYPV